MSAPNDTQYRAAARRMIAAGVAEPATAIKLACKVTHDDHGEVQRPAHGAAAYVQVWLVVPRELAAEELP